MAISINITPPVTAEDVAETIVLLQTIGGVDQESIELAMTATPEFSPDTPRVNTADGSDNTSESKTSEDTAFAKSSDGQMVPWDERIHSKNKTVNQDGSWKLKRGVDKDELKDIEAELVVAAMVATDDGTAPESEPEQTPEPPAPPVPPAPVEPAGEVRYRHGNRTFTKEDLLTGGWTEAQIAELETVEPETPAAPIPPAPAQTGEPLTFAEVAMRINSKGIDMAEVNAKVAELAAKHGKANVANFAFLATPANAAILADLVTEYGL